MSTAALKPYGTDRTCRLLAYCGVLLIAALYVVGIESHGVLRHVVQTLPVWPTVILGFRHSAWSKWTGLPCFVVWLSLMTLIWLFLLGWSHLLSGTFTPIEIAMTLVVGFCSVAGILLALRLKTVVRTVGAVVVSLGMLILQCGAVWISFLPAIAHDRW
jgi:hypothetical protein